MAPSRLPCYSSGIQRRLVETPLLDVQLGQPQRFLLSGHVAVYRDKQHEQVLVVGLPCYFTLEAA